MADTGIPKSFKPEDENSASEDKLSKKTKLKKITKNNNQAPNSAIPKNIANRMARRVAITTGLPTISGMGVFIISYLIVSRGIADIPPALTLLTSAGCFLLGLFGLSYGILSASWEDTSGTLLGIENIRPNIEKVIDTFKALTQNEK